MRNTLVSVALAVLLAPEVVAAQEPDKKVAGGGDVAPGWQMRIDPNASRGAPPKFVAMGSGFHATSGAFKPSARKFAPNVMIFPTRSGWCIAKSKATSPPSLQPSMSAFFTWR